MHYIDDRQTSSPLHNVSPGMYAKRSVTLIGYLMPLTYSCDLKETQVHLFHTDEWVGLQDQFGHIMGNINFKVLLCYLRAPAAISILPLTPRNFTLFTTTFFSPQILLDLYYHVKISFCGLKSNPNIAELNKGK